MIRKVKYGILLGSCALASYFLWPKYPVSAVGAAALGMTGLVYLVLANRKRSHPRHAADTAGIEVGDEGRASLTSVIICSIDPVKYAIVCASLRDRFGDLRYEVIGIHDAKSLSEGYNRGIDQSQGDVLIFCHDDIEIISPSFPHLVHEHLRTFDVIGCAGTVRLKDSRWMSSGDPHVHGVIAYPSGKSWPSDLFHVSMWGGKELTQIGDIQALDGVFIAINRRIVESVRFDEETFDGFHGYDTDFTYSAFLHGFKLGVCKDILIAHKSIGDFENSYKTYASRFWEKYKNRLPEKTSDGIGEQIIYPNVSHAQMLKAWF